MLLRWNLGIWGLLIMSNISVVLKSLEPDFERLFPVSPYEQVHQTLIKIWEQQGQVEQQVYYLTRLIELIGNLKWLRSQPFEIKQNSCDLDYQVRLLDFIQLNLTNSSTDQVARLLAVARTALVELV